MPRQAFRSSSSADQPDRRRGPTRMSAGRDLHFRPARRGQAGHHHLYRRGADDVHAEPDAGLCADRSRFHRRERQQRTRSRSSGPTSFRCRQSSGSRFRRRSNRYSPVPVEARDQAQIEIYGPRVGSVIQAHEICDEFTMGPRDRADDPSARALRPDQVHFHAVGRILPARPDGRRDHHGRESRPVELPRPHPFDRGRRQGPARDHGRGTCLRRLESGVEPIRRRRQLVAGLGRPGGPGKHAADLPAADGRDERGRAGLGRRIRRERRRVESMGRRERLRLGRRRDLFADRRSDRAAAAGLSDRLRCRWRSDGTRSIRFRSTSRRAAGRSPGRARRRRSKARRSSLVDSELLAYENATLVSGYAYNLIGLARGLSGSSAAFHSTGAAFARLDGAIVKYDLPPNLVGQTIYFKFQSFNVFGGGLEDLSTCAVYTFTPPACDQRTRSPRSSPADSRSISARSRRRRRSPMTSARSTAAVSGSVDLGAVAPAAHPVMVAIETGANQDLGAISSAVTLSDDFGSSLDAVVDSYSLGTVP